MFFRTHGSNEERAVDELPQQQAIAGLPISNIESSTGSVAVERAGGTYPVKAGDILYQGDAIETGADGAVVFVFTDGTEFKLSSTSRLALDEFVRDSAGVARSALIRVTAGTSAFIAGQVARCGGLTIGTPFAAVRGRAQAGGTGVLSLAA